MLWAGPVVVVHWRSWPRCSYCGVHPDRYAGTIGGYPRGAAQYAPFYGY